MPGVVRKEDPGSGHGCFPPRPSSTWSPNVFANGKNVERYGDNMQTHCCPPVCHGGVHVGSHSVYANGQSIQVISDPINCGSTCAEGSGNVFVE